MKWLIVSASSGILSAIGIVQETRTTSLLLSKWAAFLAALVITLDVVMADLVALAVPTSDRKSTRLNSSHSLPSRMPSSA